MMLDADVVAVSPRGGTHELKVLVDLDLGLHRCGVPPGEAAMGLLYPAAYMRQDMGRKKEKFKLQLLCGAPATHKILDKRYFFRSKTIC